MSGVSTDNQTFFNQKCISFQREQDFADNDGFYRLNCWQSFTITTYGVRVRVRANDPQMLQRALQHLPPVTEFVSTQEVDRCYTFEAADSRENTNCNHTLLADSVRLIETADVEAMFDAFESNLKLFVAEMSPDRVFVHAGVVGWHGQAILIPGRSYSGKTTLVAELVRAGAKYYSDEYALLDERGLVHPFAQPLGIRKTKYGKQQPRDVKSFGGKAGREPLPIGLIVVSQYREGTRGWRPASLSAGQGVLALLSNTVSARRQPQKTLEYLRQAVVGHNASIIQGTRGAAKPVANALLKILNSDY